MPVSFKFVPGTTREQARLLLHRIGELSEVETFAEIEPGNGDDNRGELAAIVVFERSGENSEEDDLAREEIAAALRKSSHVGDIDSRS